MDGYNYQSTRGYKQLKEYIELLEMSEEKIKKLAEGQLKLLEVIYAGIITKPNFYFQIKEDLNKIIDE